MARSKFYTTACSCGATDGLYPTTWAMSMHICNLTQTITSQSGCSECRNDIRRMAGLEPLDNPAYVLLEDRFAGRGVGSQMNLGI